jgi:hypothetical protein
MLLIKRRDRGASSGNGKVRPRQYQRIFPALMQLNGLFFQFAGGMQHFAPLFQQHLSGGGKARAVAAAVEQLNIEIAFQLMNGVAQRRRRFIELCRRGGKAPSFSSASRMTRTSSSGFIATPLRYAIHRWRITPSASPADRGTGTQTPAHCKYDCHPQSCRYRLRAIREHGAEAQARGPSADKRRRAPDAGRTYIIDVPALRSLQQQFDCGNHILQDAPD